MNSETFNQILEETFERCRCIMEMKSDEYATHDRLHNFKVASLIQMVSPRKALWGMANKHLVSIMDIVGGRPTDRATLDEKINDMINYLVLLKALVIEEMDNEGGEDR